ncbi:MULTISPECIES: tetratricopeptide repeat protein [Cellulophaga]|jgi:tetratricopeptide (TPR) repeat protein|uniref:Tetratricopeptide repeat protein n=1 Tax=Cellulophaga baltica 18 TaxID=1348584 RepID=A0AAU8RG77_9FLAO|nr:MULTISPECIES: tetratricopeptide repeat protein [Cellulophaga]AIY13807.1 tetratricopeptide repeat protein [Cellulophaga baltica NN016038]AIZ42188.1 tetratricopeptide repeat protein [Cellulophaga baltica 18]KGK29023.1 tetratricopeptide repeat protein [Cellulophaga sp. E6(2014)]MCR1024992.1 tetratricopeptide repeat protein [Cellulophaga baltica]QXP55359.1 tetratricopeptide repeat protein [Cellulophaga sp. HaHa_2_95]
MKTRLFIAAAMSCTMVAFSQKNELKTAEKALKSGSAAEAKTALESASSLIGGADDKMKAQYHFLKGETFAMLAKKGDASAFNTAIESYKEAIATEEASGKAKYTVESKQKLSGMTADLINAAVEDNNNKQYKPAAEKLYMGYQLSPKDTVYLYYAASSAVNGGEYEQALTYYNELKDLGYDGSEVKYTAVNVATGETEEMDKTQRDLMVKSKTYKDPKEEKSPSKSSEIIKNIALIYTQLGQDDKALGAYKDARANDPEDVNLILNEANLYFKLGDKDKFKSLMAEATALQPDNADLFYNIGVVNMEQGNIEDARAAYNRALEINPGYVNAQLNLSTTYVNEGNGMIDSMNSLGNSRADIAKYDELKKKKDGLFQKGADILEQALKLNPDNQGILEQLKNIYGALGDNENFMRLKKLIGE